MKGTLLISSYIASYSSRVSKTIHVALHAPAVEAAQVWSKADTYEGHFTLVAETVFALQRGERNIKCGTARPCPTNSASLFEIGP
jgi:hypothetical protein